MTLCHTPTGCPCTPPLRTQPSPSKNPSRIIHQLNRQIFALFLPLTCLGMCVCACICVPACVCAYWSVRHQFACIRNSFPLVIESLDKLSTAAALAPSSPYLSLSLSLLSFVSDQTHQQLVPLCKLMSVLLATLAPFLYLPLPIPPLCSSALCWHQLGELICILCGIYSKCIIQIPICVACTHIV